MRALPDSGSACARAIWLHSVDIVLPWDPARSRQFSNSTSKKSREALPSSHWCRWRCAFRQTLLTGGSWCQRDALIVGCLKNRFCSVKRKERRRFPVSQFRFGANSLCAASIGPRTSLRRWKGFARATAIRRRSVLVNAASSSGEIWTCGPTPTTSFPTSRGLASRRQRLHRSVQLSTTGRMPERPLLHELRRREGEGWGMA